MMNYIHDSRINANNYMLEMSIGEYFELVEGCLNDNEYQRKRVRNASSVYSLLKKDLIQGCIMPPIVLAYSEIVDANADIITVLKNDRNRIKILDGLQRSYTIKDIINDIRKGDLVIEDDHNPLNNLIRVEVYAGLSKVGLLYRMLTLNTGQTQMTTRHQIEIIYSDYKENCNVQGVKLISEVDDITPKFLGEYKFRDVVDGFTSYLQKNYLTLDRLDILENVKNLERLSGVGLKGNVFDDFLNCYHKFVVNMNNFLPIESDGNYLTEYLQLSATPYATSMIKMFNKSQSMTGFGNAIATLQDRQIIKDFDHLMHLVNSLNSNVVELGFLEMIKDLDKVRVMAKKIGNDQRLYFYHFFKKLFDEHEDAYLNINEAARAAYSEYERIVS